MNNWYVVSQYYEDTVLEGTWATEEAAQVAARRVREFRADQTEAPVVVVKQARSRAELRGPPT